MCATSKELTVGSLLLIFLLAGCGSNEDDSIGEGTTDGITGDGILYGFITKGVGGESTGSTHFSAAFGYFLSQDENDDFLSGLNQDIDSCVELNKVYSPEVAHRSVFQSAEDTISTVSAGDVIPITGRSSGTVDEGLLRTEADGNKNFHRYVFYDTSLDLTDIYAADVPGARFPQSGSFFFPVVEGPDSFRIPRTETGEFDISAPFTWTPSTFDDLIQDYIRIGILVVASGVKDRFIRCHVGDDGSFFVPSAIAATLTAASLTIRMGREIALIREIDDARLVVSHYKQGDELRSTMN